MIQKPDVSLFVYGTLLEPGVQTLVFGRNPEAHAAILAGYRIMEKAVLNTYPSIVPGPGKELSVKGQVLKITSRELELADHYETSAYYRKVIQLESGDSAWVYLHKERGE